MKPRIWLWAFLAFVFCAGSSSVGYAQRPAHYVPVRQPISPYFFYSALNTTGLPNYYQYVLPAQQFRTFIARSETQAARVEDRISLAGDRVEQLVERQLQMRGTTGVGAPATAATFMELSHFYQNRTPSRRR